MKTNNLAHVMNEKNISQTELAKQVDTSIVTINNIYNQKQEPKVGLAFKIADILDVNPRTIFSIMLISFFFFLYAIEDHKQFEPQIVSLETNLSWVVNFKNVKQ